MRIEREDGSPVGSVWAVATSEELWWLMESLQQYFREDPVDPGWHTHVGSGDHQLTIAVDGSTAGARPVAGARQRCRVCGEPVVLCDLDDPESWVHAEDANDWADHTAEVDE